MRSEIFYTDRYLQIQNSVVQLLNAQEDFLSPRTIGSPRAVGDAIQETISQNFQQLLGDACTECSTEIARIEGRIGRFEEVKHAWTMKSDIWETTHVELPMSIGTRKDDTAQ